MEIRKDYLKVKSVGAVSANELKFLWIRALGRLKSRDEAKSKYKFNTEMEEMLSRKTDHFVMDVQRALSNITDFTQRGDLSGIGKIRFWNEINRQLQLFEFKDVELRPTSKAEKRKMRDRDYRNDQRNSRNRSKSRSRSSRS